MQIRCNACGSPVSQELPDDILIRGWIECPECIEKNVEVDVDRYMKNVLRDLLPERNTYNRYRLLGSLECALCLKGVLIGGKPIPYKIIKTKNWFGQVKERSESYNEVIIRLVEETLECK